MPETRTQEFYFLVTLRLEGGGVAGGVRTSHCRVLAEDRVAARRAVIGYIAHQSRPYVPDNATEEERAHIEAHWERLRVLTMEPEAATDLTEWGVPATMPLYWWGWDELPSPG